MAVTLSFQADSRQFVQETVKATTSLSAAFSGVQNQLKQMESVSGQVSSKMVTGLQQLAAATRPAIFGVNDLGASFIKTGQAAGATTTQLQRLPGVYGAVGTAAKQAAEGVTAAGNAGKSAAAGLTLVGQNLRGAAAGLTSVGQSLRGVAAGFGLVLGVQGLASLVQSIVAAGIQMERFERTLIAATGSAKAGADAWRFITAESNRLGQSVTSMVPIFVQLTAATRNTVLEGERTRELFSALAGAGQAVGLSTDAVGGAMLGLTQIISQNAIQLDEFRNQFASRIPGAMLETARALKMLGVTQTGTIAEMLKGFERGRISVADLTKAVTMGLQEIQRTAPSMANSAEAAFTRLSNAIFQLSADIARSGLLDLLAKIARFASREVLGLGRALNIANVQDIDQLVRLREELTALQKLREQAAQQASDPSLLGKIQGAIGTGPAEQLKQLDAERVRLEGELTRLQARVTAQQTADAEQDRIGRERREEEARQLKASDAAAAASRQGAQDAAARARAQVGLTQERINQEKIALDQVQALRVQALERDYEMAVQSTEQTKAAQAQIETAFAIRRLDISRTATLEDAALQEQTALHTRDVKIAAINAADAAAQASAAAPGATAEAQINANKRSAASDLERQTVVLATQNTIQEATKKRTEAEAAYEKGVSAVVKGERTEQIQITEAQLQREAQLRQKALQGQADVLGAETELIQAQVDGLVLTEAEGLTRRQANEQKSLEIRRALLEEQFQEELRLLEERVQANKATEDEITALRTQHTQNIKVLNVQEQVQAQVHQNELLKGWREWVKDVQNALGNFLFQWMSGQVKSIKDVLNDLKSYFFRIIADMVAKAAVSAIVIPIVMTVIGGLGGGTGGTLDKLLSLIGLTGNLTGLGGGGGGGGGGADTGGTVLTGLGLGKQIYSMLGLDSLMSSVSSGFSALKETFLVGIDSLFNTSFSAAKQAANEAALLLADVTGDMGRGTAGAASGGLSPLAGIAGGLAALGGGIYAALNASNSAAKAFYSASAAAGAFATAVSGYAAITGTAALATAGGTGWTGIGLIVAAVMAVIGVVLDRVIKPEGPTLAVGGPRGLNIGTTGGKLQVQGDLGSTIFRADDVDPGVARGVQAQMEAGITNAVIKIVETINAVALDPAKLVGPTQEALQTALRNVQAINSSNAKKMEKDITEQLRFINVQIVAGMLEPVNLAFDQLRDMGTVEEQINRLPGTVAGLMGIFKTMNEQLDAIAKSENTDVKRQLSAVRNQVENFGNRIAGTAGQIAESIVDDLERQFSEQRPQRRLSAAGQAIEVMDRSIATQITEFSTLMNTSIRALAVLRSTQKILDESGVSSGGVGEQIGRLTQMVSENAARIATDLVSKALGELAPRLDQVLIQPIRIQATTINALFTDSLAALAALQVAWTQLSSAGLDTSGVQEQFSRLLGGLLESTFRVITQSFTGGSFAEFLNILLGIPPALVALNPTLQKVQELGKAFAQVVGPIEQVIDAVEEEMRTPTERIERTAQNMADLRKAIAESGDSAEQAIPLYAKLSEQIQANAQAQIDVINKMADEYIDAINKQADAQRQAIQEQVEIWRTAVQDETEILREGVRQQAEIWKKAVQDETEQQREAVRQQAEIWKDGVSAWADQQREELARVVELWTKGVNEIADAEREALQRWVDEATKMVNDWAKSAGTTAQQLARINDILLQEMSPAGQKSELEARKAVLQGIIAGGGPNAQAAISELIEVNTALLALAKKSDNLGEQKRLLEEMRAMKKVLTDRLVAMTGESDPFLAQLVIAEKSKNALEQIEAYEKWQTEVIAERQRVALEQIAAYQKWQTEVIAAEQERALKAIEAYEKGMYEWIQFNQDKRLEAIETYEKKMYEWIQDVQDKRLEAIQIYEKSMYEWVKDKQDTRLKEIRDWQEATVNAIKEDMVYQLKLVQYELQKLFVIQYKVLTGKDLPEPVAPTRPQPAVSQGGLIGIASGQYYAHGGMVPNPAQRFTRGGLINAMLEPGERVFSPTSYAQQGALLALNQAFPRFANGGMLVPGRGSGDTVPATLAAGSVVLNRRASAVVGALGMQGGGLMPASSGPPVVNIHIAKLEVRNDQDIKMIIDGITKQLRREWRSPNDKGPFK